MSSQTNQRVKEINKPTNENLPTPKQPIGIICTTQF
jgi:hypothetical protein